MENEKIILYGASGHGKVILDILRKSGINVPCIIDDNDNIKQLCGVKVCLPQSREGFSNDDSYIISIGNNKTRKLISEQSNRKYSKAIHPSATLAANTSIEEGTVVMAHAVINADASIGKHAIINTAAIVEHDCHLADFVHLSPHATLCGNVHVGEGTHIGAGATVIPNTKIGKWCTIGAGTVVLKDVPDYAVVVGNPGKIKKFNS